MDVNTKIGVAKSLILSKLDYCNCLLALCPKYLLEKLQKVINYSIRFIYKLRKQTHVTA